LQPFENWAGVYGTKTQVEFEGGPCGMTVLSEYPPVALRG